MPHKLCENNDFVTKKTYIQANFDYFERNRTTLGTDPITLLEDFMQNQQQYAIQTLDNAILMVQRN